MGPGHDDAPLPAGDLVAWRQRLLAALRGEADADVPCQGCTACCTSAQFVLVAPDERDALDHLPAELLFPAPGLPGHRVLPYDDRGHCPMLVDGACSVYAHRPRTCRTYDCRVLAATGLVGEPADKPAIAERVARWRFADGDDEQRAVAAALRAAVAFLRGRAGGTPPPTQLAAAAVAVADAFLARDAAGRLVVVEPDPAVVDAELARSGGSSPAG